MDGLLLQRGAFPSAALQKTIDFLLACQREDGSIPWDHKGKLDPWDHCESAMGLSVAGKWRAAERAYHWLRKQQLEDGSWWANYINGEPVESARRETNFIAYIATGVWHHYLVTGDKSFVLELYPCVENAINCVLKYQSEFGDIAWAFDDKGEALDDALFTGCSSIYKSLECAVNLADILGRDSTTWQQAYHRLENALRFQPKRFDRTWESKDRYSMNWFYPILAGVYEGAEAKARIHHRWDTFVRPGLGCVCVSDQPWVTVAESCELTMALLAADERSKAVSLFSNLHQWADEDGAYWTGYQYAIDEIWPVEKTSWTCAAILLAADALTEYTSASNLFLERRLDAFSIESDLYDQA